MSGVDAADSNAATSPPGRLCLAQVPQFAAISFFRGRLTSGFAWNARDRAGQAGGRGLQVLKRLDLIDFLDEIMPSGREAIPWPLMAAVLVLCRLCRPSSELHIAEHLCERTAPADLLGIPAARTNDDRLYRALDRVVFHKDALQTLLKNRLGRLFDLKYDLLLYDMTSTYFEGQANGNPKA